MQFVCIMEVVIETMKHETYLHVPCAEFLTAGKVYATVIANLYSILFLGVCHSMHDLCNECWITSVMVAFIDLVLRESISDD